MHFCVNIPYHVCRYRLEFLPKHLKFHMWVGTNSGKRDLSTIYQYGLEPNHTQQRKTEIRKFLTMWEFNIQQNEPKYARNGLNNRISLCCHPKLIYTIKLFDLTKPKSSTLIYILLENKTYKRKNKSSIVVFVSTRKTRTTNQKKKCYEQNYKSK